MGLRMYDDPDEIKTKQPAIKTDPTAPARSAIRRQRTVRYSSTTRPPSFHTVSSTTYRPSSSHGRIGSPSDPRLLLHDARRRMGLSTHPLRRTAAQVAELEAALPGHSYTTAEIAHLPAREQIRLLSDPRFPRGSLSHERSGERPRMNDYNTVLNAPETLHSENSVPGRQLVDAVHPREDEARVTRRQYWPTPPYSSGGSSESSPVHQSNPTLGTAALTPRFAPAHGQPRQAVGERTVGVQTFAIRQNSLALLARRIPSPLEAVNDQDRTFLITLASELEAMRNMTPDMLTAPYLAEEAAYLRSVEIRLNLLSVNGTGEDRSNSLDDLPPLHRMGQQYENEAQSTAARRHLRRSQRARARQDTLDGLGDRQRSFSPDDDAWETMLTTITPDERVPSAHSSFTTATASATSRSSNWAGTSHGTSSTFPSSTLTSAEIEACIAEGITSDDDEDENADDANDMFEFPDEDAWAATRHLEDDSGVVMPSTSSSSGPAGESPDAIADRRWQRQQSRLEYLWRRLARHRAHYESRGQRARDMEHEGELRWMESTIQGMERQLLEERAAGRQRPEERL